jgi:hypothetical protein
VEDEMRLGGQVQQPGPRARSGNPAQVDGILEPVNTILIGAALRSVDRSVLTAWSDDG